MSIETRSLAIRIWHDEHATSNYLRVVWVDGAREVQLSEGNFVLRIVSDSESMLTRCSIRHIASGREAHLQGGSGLSAFIRDCLVQDAAPNLFPAEETRG